MVMTDKSINELFDYSRLMVDEATKNKNYSKKFKNIMILSFAALLEYYGYDYVTEIYSAFEKQYFFGNKRKVISNIIKNEDDLDYNINRIKNGRYAGICSYIIDEKDYNGIPFYIVNSNVYIRDSINTDYIDLLECSIHEINHLINSYNKNIIIKKDNYYLRSGIVMTNIKTKKKNNLSLEEAINVLQTAEITNIILYFSEFNIKDKNLDKILTNIRNKNYIKRTGIGYKSVVDLVRPLYSNQEFKTDINSSRITGNIDNIKTEFNTRTHSEGFNELSTTLDTIYLYNIEKDIKEEKLKVKSLVKRYLEK